LCGSTQVNQLEAGLDSHWMIIWWWASWQPWLWTWTSPTRIFLDSPCGGMY